MPSGAAGDRIGYWPRAGQITRRKIRRKIRWIAGLRSGKIAGGQIGRVFRITAKITAKISAKAGRRHGRRAKRVLISGHLGSFHDQRRHHQTNDPITLPVPSGFLTAADFATSRPAFRRTAADPGRQRFRRLFPASVTERIRQWIVGRSSPRTIRDVFWQGAVLASVVAARGATSKPRQRRPSTRLWPKSNRRPMMPRRRWPTR